MLARGASDIKGVHCLNTRPGPITEGNGLLMLYRLAVEKENLIKRLAWAKRRKSQTERRLSEVVPTMRSIEQRAKRETTSHSRSHYRSTFATY